MYVCLYQAIVSASSQTDEFVKELLITLEKVCDRASNIFGLKDYLYKGLFIIICI